MKKTIIIPILISLALFSCNQSSQTKTEQSVSAEVPKEAPHSKTPEELKEELRVNEESKPAEYLSAEGEWKENNVKVKEEGIFSDAEFKQDGYNITGTIQSSASVATFKDAIVRVKYLSQTSSVIKSEDFTVYDYVEPNHSTEFHLKVYPPKAAPYFQLEIVGATPTGPVNTGVE